MKYKTKIVDGKKVSFSSDWICDLESELHFNWYFQQANIVYRNCSRDTDILEIGIGTGLLSDLLKKRGWNIKTLDIDEDKSPDYCESALDFDYKINSVKVVIAFEIFEHIPYDTFLKLLSRLCAHGVRDIYFSLPWCEKQILKITMKLPKLQQFNINVFLPRKNIIEPLHYWELHATDHVADVDKQLISVKRLKEVFAENSYLLRPINKIQSIQYFSATRVGL